MNEMKINLVMDENKNIIVTNLDKGTNFTISYVDKVINALSVYQILNYQLNSIYALNSNISEITDENDRIYFKDIITLLESIISEINEMAEGNEKSESSDCQIDLE